MMRALNMSVATVIFLLVGMLATPVDSYCRKIKSNLKYDKKSVVSSQRNLITTPLDSFLIVSDNKSLRFTGYDKSSSSAAESFFIVNESDFYVADINITITYLLTSGSQLNKRREHIKCALSPGETKIFHIPSFDKQHSFHYFKSKDSRTPTTPYKVKFALDSLTFRP